MCVCVQNATVASSKSSFFFEQQIKCESFTEKQTTQHAILIIIAIRVSHSLAMQ